MPNQPTYTWDDFERCTLCSSTGSAVYHPRDIGGDLPEELSTDEVRQLVEPPILLTTPAAVRAWARAAGHAVAASGPIPRSIYLLYSDAHRSAGASTPTPNPMPPQIPSIEFHRYEDGSLADEPCVYRFFGLDCPDDYYDDSIDSYRRYEHSVSENDGNWLVMSDSFGQLNLAGRYSPQRYSGRWYISGRWGRYGDREDVRIGLIRIMRPLEPCASCGDTTSYGRRANRYDTPDGRICGGCVAICACHSTYRARAHLIIARSEYWCEGHVPTCAECGNAFGEREIAYLTLDADYVCRNCAPTCGECGSYLNERGRCVNCRSRRRNRNIRGYGHTVPTRWLGGEPISLGGTVPYHLGIELEVTSRSDDDTDPIGRWARENLEARESLDLKEDSSVRGFEIVTMPMSPEYFESRDWESFFEMLNDCLEMPDGGEEPNAHGLHVHISRTAFSNNDTAVAAFCYLLGRHHEHLERISRRAATHYCDRISHPVSEALAQGKNRVMQYKARNKGHYPRRGAINLGNAATIEIRAGKSTRDAGELRNQVRLVYVAAEYIRFLMGKGGGFISPVDLKWDRFATWTRTAFPNAYASISGTTENN